MTLSDTNKQSQKSTIKLSVEFQIKLTFDLSHVTSSLISLTLLRISKTYGKDCANQVIVDLNLDKLGWQTMENIYNKGLIKAPTQLQQGTLRARSGAMFEEEVERD